MDKSELVKSGEGFIDRSKVRILLCDSDAKSSDEVFTLLCRCSYEVTPVRSPRQVTDALNAEGPDIDIILSEVDLPMSKGFKLLKYIMRDKELRRIPIIMMSAQDEMSIVVKCLKLGAADYLVKPLRTNELLNLWTHVWRRRRMLGLAEKNILNYDFNMVASDPSDANTNSTTLFSDDSDDKSRKSSNPDISISSHQEQEIGASAAHASAPVETLLRPPVQRLPDVPGISDRRSVPGQFLSYPMKSELNNGKSSAFFTYVKASASKSSTEGVISSKGNIPQHFHAEDMVDASRVPAEAIKRTTENGGLPLYHIQVDDNASSNPDSFSAERSCTPPISFEFSQVNSKEFSELYPRNGSHPSASKFQTHTPYPYYIPGAINRMMMPSSQVYQESMSDLNNHVSSAMVSQYIHVPQCTLHMPGMASYPYCPVSICLQPGTMTTPHPWPYHGSPASNEAKGSNIDRREAALMKFRKKRKERCFDKKIRYVNRKQMAERRPRVKGQFVRKVRKENGVTVDLNGQPASAEDDDIEEEYYEDDFARTNHIDSSPEPDSVS